MLTTPLREAMFRLQCLHLPTTTHIKPDPRQGKYKPQGKLASLNGTKGRRAAKMYSAVLLPGTRSVSSFTVPKVLKARRRTGKRAG